MPNLIATRTTFSFDDSPQQALNGGYPQRLGLHLTGSSKAEVSVRSEKEPIPASASSASPAYGGLATWGEFGSGLLIIMSDSAQGKTTWSHWEQTSSGLMAVFHYEVPKAASHYEIDTPIEQTQSNGGSNRWFRIGGDLTGSSAIRTLRSKPAYQGSLWIDPTTGAITRVTLVADLKGNPTFRSGAILVEYGPVQIADKTLICPVRSLALSAVSPSVNTTLAGVATEWLNENLFTGYHLFGSTSRILTSGADSATPQTAPKQADTSAVGIAQLRPEAQASPSAHSIPPPQEALPSPPQSPIDGQPAQSSAAKVEIPSTQSINNDAGTPTMPKSAPNIPTAESATPSVSAAVATAPPDTGMTLHINVNSVLVPVVVRDGQGRVVDDLQKQDFRVFDDGKPHSLSGFLVERHANPEVQHQDARTSEPALQPTVRPERISVFIFDDLHLTFAEIAQVQSAALKALGPALTGSDMAVVVSTSGKINSGLTRDRAKLRDAIMAVRPFKLFRSNSADCPKIDYYQADLIVNKHDAAALQDATRQVMLNCNPNMSVEAAGDLAKRIAESAAMRTLQVGDRDVLTTYDAISEYVRRMAKLPGQRTMILVSPGFLPIEEAARNAESRLINLAADSNVTINALDARGLYATSGTANEDLRNRNPTQLQDYRQSEMKAEENSMGELADATGGAFFHNNNDLEAGFEKLLENPETLYVLELPLEGVKPNGAYHSLRVKIDRADSHVQARHGYVAPEPEHTKK